MNARALWSLLQSSVRYVLNVDGFLFKDAVKGLKTCGVDFFYAKGGVAKADVCEGASATIL